MGRYVALLALLLTAQIGLASALEAQEAPRWQPLSPEQKQAAWWQAQVDRALATRDPVLQNRRITALHRQFSGALRKVVGPAAGANFHSWAVWGSTKAGVTIRGEDFTQALAHGAFDRLPGGAASGRTLAWMAGDAAGGSRSGPEAIVGTLLGKPVIEGIARSSRRQAKQALIEANRLVIRITAQHTIRFLTTFHDLDRPDAIRLARFLAPFRRGASVAGGEDQLRRAYRRYYDARFAADLDRAREASFEAVLRTMLHEMNLMQPYFERAMPKSLGRVVTRYFSHFRVGTLRFDMLQDLPKRPISPELGRLDDRGLRTLFTVLRMRGGVKANGEGSRIRNLSIHAERLGYLASLARQLHNDPALHAA